MQEECLGSCRTTKKYSQKSHAWFVCQMIKEKENLNNNPKGKTKKGLCLMWMKRKSDNHYHCKTMRKFSHKKANDGILFFFCSSKNNSENIAQRNFVIIVINSGILKQHERGGNWQYYSLERIYFYSFASSSSPPRLLPRLFGLIHLRRNAKSKPAIKACYVFFCLSFSLQTRRHRRRHRQKSVSWEFTGNIFFISFGFVRKQFQLFQESFFLKQLKTPFFKKTFTGTNSKGK